MRESTYINGFLTSKRGDTQTGLTCETSVVHHNNNFFNSEYFAAIRVQTFCKRECSRKWKDVCNEKKNGCWTKTSIYWVIQKIKYDCKYSSDICKFDF